MEALELEKKKLVLEENIQNLIMEFISNVGECDVRLHNHTSFSSLGYGKKKLVTSKVEVKIMV